MDPQFDGVIFHTHPAELARRLRFAYPPYRVLDVRPAEAFADGHIPGALSLPGGELSGALPAGASPSTELFVVGEDPFDLLVRRTTRELRRLGAYRAVEVSGGMHAWRAAGLPEERAGAGEKVEVAA